MSTQRVIQYCHKQGCKDLYDFYDVASAAGENERLMRKPVWSVILFALKGIVLAFVPCLMKEGCLPKHLPNSLTAVDLHFSTLLLTLRKVLYYTLSITVWWRVPVHNFPWGPWDRYNEHNCLQERQNSPWSFLIYLPLKENYWFIFLNLCGNKCCCSEAAREP